MIIKYMFIRTEKTTALIMISMIIFVLFFGFMKIIQPMKIVKTCSQYKSQKEAQKDLKFNSRLDGNPKNGLACDSYKYAM